MEKEIEKIANGKYVNIEKPKNIKCLFLKEGKCNSDYYKEECDGINIPEKCPYKTKKW